MHMVLFAKKVCIVGLVGVVSFWLIVKIFFLSLYQFDVSRFIILNLNSTLENAEAFIDNAPPEKLERIRLLIDKISDERPAD